MASSQILIKKDEDQSINQGKNRILFVVMAFCVNSMSIRGDMVRIFDYHSFIFSSLPSCLCD